MKVKLSRVFNVPGVSFSESGVGFELPDCG